MMRGLTPSFLRFLLARAASADEAAAASVLPLPLAPAMSGGSVVAWWSAGWPVAGVEVPFMIEARAMRRGQ